MQGVKIRGPVKEDVDYIMATWLTPMRRSYVDLPDDLFFPTYRALIKRVIASSEIAVAESEGRIVGYAVYWRAEGVLHWLHTRNKNEELAKLLLSSLPPSPDYTFVAEQYRLLLGSLRRKNLRRLKQSKPQADQ